MSANELSDIINISKSEDKNLNSFFSEFEESEDENESSCEDADVCKVIQPQNILCDGWTKLMETESNFVLQRFNLVINGQSITRKVNSNIATRGNLVVYR